MAYIGQKPTDKPLSASDLEDGLITNAKLAQDIISAETELATSPADTDEFLISDAGVLKRLDASLVGGGGKILQVIEDLSDVEFESSSSSFVTTGLSVNITPSATSSKILIMATPQVDNKSATSYLHATIYRDSTNLAVGTEGMQIWYFGDGSRSYGGLPLMKLDSPNTTSQVTYAVYVRSNGGGTLRVGQSNLRQSIVVMEVGA